MAEGRGCKYLDLHRAFQHLEIRSTSVFASLPVGVPFIFILNKVFHTETNGEKLSYNCGWKPTSASLSKIKMIITKLGISQKPRTKMWARIEPVTPKTRICKASDGTESRTWKKKSRVQRACFLCLSVLFLFVNRFYYYFFCREVLSATLSTWLAEAAKSKLPKFTRCQGLADWSSDRR